MWSAMLYCLVMCTYKGFFFPGTQSLHCRKSVSNVFSDIQTLQPLIDRCSDWIHPREEVFLLDSRSHKHLFLSFFFLFFFLAPMTERKSFFKIFDSWHCQLRLRRAGTEVQRLWASVCVKKNEGGREQKHLKATEQIFQHSVSVTESYNSCRDASNLFTSKKFVSMKTLLIVSVSDPDSPQMLGCTLYITHSLLRFGFRLC